MVPGPEIRTLHGYIFFTRPHPFSKMDPLQDPYPTHTPAHFHCVVLNLKLVKFAFDLNSFKINDPKGCPF